MENKGLFHLGFPQGNTGLENQSRCSKVSWEIDSVWELTTPPNRPQSHPGLLSKMKAPVDDEKQSAHCSVSSSAFKNPCPTFPSSSWGMGVRIKGPKPGWGEIMQTKEFN